MSRLSGSMRMVGLVSAGVLAGVLAVPTLGYTDSTDPSPTDKVTSDDSRVQTWSIEDAEVEAAAAPGSRNLEFVGFDTGCRFLDTRLTTPFASGESRDLSVVDAGLPSGLGPCGVPAHAVGVQLSLSTLANTPAGTGFARVGPGGVAPTATVLQFLKNQGVSVTTNSALSSTDTIRLYTSVASGFVGDLLGYWQEPLWGRVAADGTLLDGNGVVWIEKDTTYLGDYYVFFDRPIWPGCAATATPESSDIRLLALPYGDPSYPDVYYFDARLYNTFDEADGGFSFIIQC